MSDRMDGFLLILTGFIVVISLILIGIIFFDVPSTPISRIIHIQVTDAYMHGARRWATLENGQVVLVWPKDRIGDIYYRQENPTLAKWLKGK